MAVCSNPNSIFRHIWDKGVASTMDYHHKLSRVLVELELRILHLLGCKTWGRCNSGQDRIHVGGGYDAVHDEVPPRRCEFHDHQVSWTGGIISSKATCFIHNGLLWHFNLFHNHPQRLNKAVVHKATLIICSGLGNDFFPKRMRAEGK